MADIFPFRAWRYDPQKVGKLELVVTQPYDKITPAMQERYYSLSPFNLARIIRGRTEPGDDEKTNVYLRAAAYVRDWMQQGVLLSDPIPALYAYDQEYEVPGRKERKRRRGFIALGQIEDYSAGVVFRHEQTLSAPKADRLELLRQTRSHFGQIFMLYSDPSRQIERTLEAAARQVSGWRVEDEYGVTHSVWPLTDPPTISKVVGLMSDKKLIIADGHHRYETALNYRNECRERLGSAGGGVDLEAPHERVMMTFVNMHSEGLTILPTHRLVSGLPRFDFKTFRYAAAAFFNWYGYPTAADQAPDGLAQFHRDMARRGGQRPAIGLAVTGDSSLYLFLLKQSADLAALLPGTPALERQLDVVILHKLLLERCLGLTPESVTAEQNVSYVREFDAGWEAVRSGGAQMCFFLNPVRIEQVSQIAFSGGVLPQKSTDFYPKLLSGLTIYRLDG